MTEKQKTEATVLYKQGRSFADIGRIYNISRQRAHQIITGYKSFACHGFSYKNMELALLENYCKLCSAKMEHIHYIDKNSGNNTLSNLLPVCYKCHNKIHSGFILPLDKKYIKIYK